MHAPKLVLFHGDTSTASAKVRLALAEKGLAYESRMYVLRRGEHRNADYLAINPAGVVPTLAHGEQIVRESNVILEYVEEAFPEPPLMPKSPIERAQARLLMREADHLHDACSILSSVVKLAQMRAAPSELATALSRVSDPHKHQRQLRLAELGFEAPDVAQAVARYRSSIRIAADSLRTTPWLSGAAFGLADVAALPFFHRADRLGLDMLWADCSELRTWLDAMRARPSYADAILAFESGLSPYHPSPELAATVRRLVERT